MSHRFRENRPRLPEPVEEKLIADWTKLRYALKNGDSCDDLIWSVDLMNRLIDENPIECLRVVARIATFDQTDFMASNLGAGPIEDLLRTYGSQIVDEIEEKAATDVNFKRTLGGVWPHSVPEEIRERWQCLVRTLNK